ncbi:unnamed protein product [Symbiodinium sp. KB8]|nr:unnamed protein product [Symbiodinium sp. KB8]
MLPAPCWPVFPCPRDADNLTDSVPDAHRPLHCFLEAIAEGNIDTASSSSDWSGNARAWSPGGWDEGLPQQPVPALQGAQGARSPWHPATTAGACTAQPAALPRPLAPSAPQRGLPQQPVPALQGASSAWHPTTTAGARAAVPEENMDTASSSSEDWSSNARAWSPGGWDRGLPQQAVPALQGARSAWHPPTTAGARAAQPAVLPRQQASARADVQQLQPLARSPEVVASFAEYLGLPAGQTETAFSERFLMALPDMMHLYEQYAEKRRSHILWKKRIDAVVGDRLNELYLVMECLNNGLTSKDYDRLRREILSAKGLGEGRGRTEAEAKEEKVGAYAKEHSHRIQGMLRPAVESAIYDHGQGESLRARIVRRAEEESKIHLTLEQTDFTQGLSDDAFLGKKPEQIKEVSLRMGIGEISQVKQGVDKLVTWFRKAEELQLDRLDFSGTKLADDALGLILKLPCFHKLRFLGLADTLVSVDGLCDVIEEVFRCRAGEPQPERHCLNVKMGYKFWPRSQPKDQQKNRWHALQGRVSEVGGRCRYFDYKRWNKSWMLHIVKYQDRDSAGRMLLKVSA